MARNYADVIRMSEDGRWLAVLVFIIGISYGVAGLLEMAVSLSFIPPIPGFNDFVGGLLLIIIASVFLTGVRPLLKNEQEGYAFIAVGYILAAILFALQIMVMITNALGWILRYQDWLNWNIINDITPSLWMFIILMTSTGVLWIFGNLREKLSPKRTVEDLH